MEEQNPTIKLSNEFKKWLEVQGKKAESYESIIKRLIPSYKEPKKELRIIAKKTRSGEFRREMKKIPIE